jgi:uncharacterized membrane protein YphA (DoxX/SURF4 family)
LTDDNQHRFQIGLAGVVALVALRVGIGWHFYYEGMWKYQHPDEASAANYFRGAKGPWAESYRSMVPDIEGRGRLDRGWVKDQLEAFRQRAEKHYGFDDAQSQRSQQMLTWRDRQVGAVLVDNKTEIADYLRELDRLNATAARGEARSMPSEQRYVFDKRAELAATIKPYLDQIDAIQQAYASDIAMLIAPRENDSAALKALKLRQQSAGPVPPARTTLDLIDGTTCWLVMLVGFCLMVGLFTRVAAACGAGFLLLVVLAMPALPNVYPPAHPSAGHALLINKEVIEMLALLVLAATPAGRWGGLDFFIYHLLIRPFYGVKVAT